MSILFLVSPDKLKLVYFFIVSHIFFLKITLHSSLNSIYSNNGGGGSNGDSSDSGNNYGGSDNNGGDGSNGGHHSYSPP